MLIHTVTRISAIIPNYWDTKSGYFFFYRESRIASALRSAPIYTVGGSYSSCNRSREQFESIVSISSSTCRVTHSYDYMHTPSPIGFMKRSVRYVLIFFGLFLAIAASPEASANDDSCTEKEVAVVFRAEGQHVMFDIRGADSVILDDENAMRDIVTTTVRVSGLTQLSLHSHRLEPQGVSVIAVLKESHMAIHTWPEHGTALADLFSCQKEGIDKDRIARSLLEDLGGAENESSWTLIRRGGGLGRGG